MTRRPASLSLVSAIAAATAAAAGCALDAPPAPPPTAEVAAPLISYQGTSYAGVPYQGITHDGLTYPNIRYQSTGYGGATLDGAPLTSVALTGTAITAWRQRLDRTWEQRTPDRLCVWDETRARVLSCTTVDLAVAPSPLAGTRWVTTLTSTNLINQEVTTFQATVELGAATSALGAVARDSSLALFGLPGSAAATAGCELVPQGTGGCVAPGGCRRNCDVWLYDVRLADVLDATGQPVPLCQDRQPAIAVSGTWSPGGQVSASRTQFTFACTGGTIAKCARWGYRPWDRALKSDLVAPTTALGPYHQACVRAATADYCATGTSFTRDGTLVDLYDYPTTWQAGSAPGFIARTRGKVVADHAATAFVFESGFDPIGATHIDHLRYGEVIRPSPYHPDLRIACPGYFTSGSGDAVPTQYNRVASPAAPLVVVDSTPACAHSEATLGKPLHAQCSACTQKVHDYQGYYDGTAWVYPYGYCSRDGMTWDAGCVAAAQARCTAADRMTTHSECTTGSGLGPYTTGCTLTVALDPANAHCATTWDGACVTAADTRCTGGREKAGRPEMAGIGFCGGTITSTGP